MRFLLELAIAGLLIAMAWSTPFKYWVSNPPAAPTPPPVARATPIPQAPRAVAARPTPPSWVWDKSRTTSLDRPAYNQKDGVARAPDIPQGVSVFTDNPPNSQVLLDSHGRSYWVDQNGGHHFIPR